MRIPLAVLAILVLAAPALVAVDRLTPPLAPPPLEAHPAGDCGGEPAPRSEAALAPPTPRLVAPGGVAAPGPTAAETCGEAAAEPVVSEGARE